MDLQEFITSREYLYHLTDKRNLKSILADYKLKSTATLVKLSSEAEKAKLLRSRRANHYPIKVGKFDIILRDQRPLSEKIVMKNITKGWTFQDFVYSLNSRVFFWATEKDLRSHYKRYENEDEYPIILKFKTSELFSLNKNFPQFCKYNSGAPRAHNSFSKGAAPRGENTFLESTKFPDVVGAVREVTFINICNLPKNILLSIHPDKPYKKLI